MTLHLTQQLSLFYTDNSSTTKGNTVNTIISSLLRAACDGTFFTVTFVKKDGTIRTMNCRTGVRKYVKGTGIARDNEDLITVFDVKKNAYRSIPISRVTAVRVKGVEAAVAV